jgi:hypothetical protein
LPSVRVAMLLFHFSPVYQSRQKDPSSHESAAAAVNLYSYLPRFVEIPVTHLHIVLAADMQPEFNNNHQYPDVPHSPIPFPTMGCVTWPHARTPGSIGRHPLC